MDIRNIESFRVTNFAVAVRENTRIPSRSLRKGTHKQRRVTTYAVMWYVDDHS
jgi:hypothetical protein